MDRVGQESRDKEVSSRFHYVVGGIARLILPIRHREILLTRTQLLLAGPDGAGEAVLPEEIVPPIGRNNGWFWSTVDLQLHDGRSVSLAGVGKSEARQLVQMVDAWIAPARQRFFVSVEAELAAVERRIEGVLNCERYVRQSDVRSVSDDLGAQVERIAAQLRAPDRPEALYARFKLLRRQLPELPVLVAEANERFVRNTIDRKRPVWAH